MSTYRDQDGGELEAELAAFALDAMQLVVVLGIVRQSSANSALSWLPRTSEDVSGTVILRVAGELSHQAQLQPQPVAGQSQQQTAPPAQQQTASTFVHTSHVHCPNPPPPLPSSTPTPPPPPPWEQLCGRRPQPLHHRQINTCSRLCGLPQSYHPDLI